MDQVAFKNENKIIKSSLFLKKYTFWAIAINHIVTSYFFDDDINWILFLVQSYIFVISFGRSPSYRKFHCKPRYQISSETVNSLHAWKYIILQCNPLLDTKQTTRK